MNTNRSNLGMVSTAVLSLWGLVGCGGGAGGDQEVGEWVREEIEFDDFNRSNPSPWQLTGLWKTDALPGTVQGNDLSYLDTPSTSSDRSLNYNSFDPDSSTYDYHTVSAKKPSPNKGAAKLSDIDVKGYRNVLLSFWCNHNTDPFDQGDLTKDKRSVEVARNGIVYRLQLTSTPYRGTLSTDVHELVVCPPSVEGWHKHEIPLDKALGLFQIENWDAAKLSCTFVFDTVDPYHNSGRGWFIENFAMSGEYFYD